MTDEELWCRCGALSDHLGVWRGDSWKEDPTDAEE
jgi:hypothetical protein